MSETINHVLQTIDEQHADKPAATRRQLVAGAGAALGTLGLLGLADRAAAQDSTPGGTDSPNTIANIANIAATAEVLATIVNTVGAERVNLDAVTRRTCASPRARS
jgi:succinyl-CoA synthetase beta subunit